MIERLRTALSLCEGEVERRELDYAPDARFDVPFSMLLDLLDEVEGSANPAEVDRLIQDLHGQVGESERAESRR